MKLLIAEDEQDLAEALTAFFEKNQFTVDAVPDGQEAYTYAFQPTWEDAVEAGGNGG